MKSERRKQRETEHAMKIFGFSSTPTRDQLRSEYRKLALKHHPDRGGSTSKFKALNWANSVLNEHLFSDENKSEIAATQQQTQQSAEAAAPSGVSATEPDESAMPASEIDTEASFDLSSPLGDVPATKHDEAPLPASEIDTEASFDLSSPLPASEIDTEASLSSPLADAPQPGPSQEYREPSTDEAREPFENSSYGPRGQFAGLADMFVQNDGVQQGNSKGPSYSERFTGGMAHGFDLVGGLTGNQEFSMLGGKIEAASEIANAFGEGGGFSGTLNNLFGGDSANAAEASGIEEEKNDELIKTIKELIDAIKDLKKSSKPAPGGFEGDGGTNIPSGGSFGTGSTESAAASGASGSDTELLATMIRMLMLAAA